MRLLIELLRPVGAELGRRWLAALLLVPPEERRAVVEAVTRQVVAEYGGEPKFARDGREGGGDGRESRRGKGTSEPGGGGTIDR